MGTLIGLVGNLAGLVSFVLGILIAIKMFQRGMIWQGVLTIICWIFGVIYANSRKAELGIEKLYMPYLLAGVISIALAILSMILGGGDAA